MDELAKSFGPAFAAGFAVQRTLEILDPAFSWIGDSKKIVLGVISLVMGVGIAFGAQLQVIHTLSSAISIHPQLDMFISGLVISGGTEGFNSIMKFLSYKKEQTKADALTKAPTEEKNKEAFRKAASRI